MWLNVSVDRLCIGYYSNRYLDYWLCINPCQTESIRRVIWKRTFPIDSAKQQWGFIKATKNGDAGANQRGKDTRVLQQKEPENWWFLRTGVGAYAQTSLINISIRLGVIFLTRRFRSLKRLFRNYTLFLLEPCDLCFCRHTRIRTTKGKGDSSNLDILESRKQVIF